MKTIRQLYMAANLDSETDRSMLADALEDEQRCREAALVRGNSPWLWMLASGEIIGCPASHRGVPVPVRELLGAARGGGYQGGYQGFGERLATQLPELAPAGTLETDWHQAVEVLRYCLTVTPPGRPGCQSTVRKWVRHYFPALLPQIPATKELIFLEGLARSLARHPVAQA